jgi:hypothetical protein
MAEENTEVKAETKAETPVKLRKAPLKLYKITFHGEGGDVEVGHNFKLNLYKRNVETTIDENFLGVVRDAVITTVVEDGDGNKKHVRIPQFNYTVEAI